MRLKRRAFVKALAALAVAPALAWSNPPRIELPAARLLPLTSPWSEADADPLSDIQEVFRMLRAEEPPRLTLSPTAQRMLGLRPGR